MIYDLMTLPDEPEETPGVDMRALRLADIERRLTELEARPILTATPAPVVLEEIVSEDTLTEVELEALKTVDLRDELDRVEALHDAKQALLDEVLKICKPSVSKLANQIRALLEPMPVIEPEAPKAEEQPEPAAAQNGVAYAAGPPAHDAPVEEWRAHARALGYNGPDVDKANRSQIRTMLGIEQPVES